MHPLFKLLVSHPTAVTDHLEAYASLAAQELTTTAAKLRSRALKTVMALGCATAALGLSGVALMLWAITPAANLHAPWALWVAPGLPAVAALWCWVSAQSGGDPAAFDTLRGQVRQDLALLREVST